MVPGMKMHGGYKHVDVPAIERELQEVAKVRVQGISKR